MPVLTSDQLAAIRAASFDFNAPFLGRMAIAFADFIQADGMLAVEASPGPLTELAANHALLTEILDGADRWTTPTDRSRVQPAARLAEFFAQLDELCRRRCAMSLPEMIELRSRPDLYDADFLNRVADAHRAFADAARALLDSGEQPEQAVVRDVYRAAEEAIRAALESPAQDDPAKAEAIERLSSVRDDLRELIG